MSEENLCVKCEKRPVLVKKRNLCRLCYQRERKKNGPFINPTSHNYAHPQYRENQKISREMAFVKNFFNHSDWIYSPATFKFNGLKYTPDFYDSHRNTFIEVAGSRQAYHQNKNKYASFRKYFPKLNFEIRQPDGSLLNESNDNKLWQQ